MAAVKISRVYSEQEILGTATGRHSGLNVHKSSRFPATAGHRYTTPAGVMELVDVVDSKSTVASPSAACGRCSEGAASAAVDKIEERRKPEDFIGYRKRWRHSAACKAATL